MSQATFTLIFTPTVRKSQPRRRMKGVGRGVVETPIRTLIAIQINYSLNILHSSVRISEKTCFLLLLHRNLLSVPKNAYLSAGRFFIPSKACNKEKDLGRLQEKIEAIKKIGVRLLERLSRCISMTRVMHGSKCFIFFWLLCRQSI